MAASTPDSSDNKLSSDSFDDEYEVNWIALEDENSDGNDDIPKNNNQKRDDLVEQIRNLDKDDIIHFTKKKSKFLKLLSNIKKEVDRVETILSNLKRKYNEIDTIIKECDDEIENKRLRKISKEYVEAHYEKATILNKKGDISGAEWHYLEVIRIDPNHANAHYNYANLLKNKNQYKDIAGAERHFKEALRINPDFTNAHISYALLIKDHNKDIVGAERHYQKALRINPDHAVAHIYYAILLVDKKDIAGAEQHFKEALRINPDYAKAHYNYASLLVNYKKDIEGAERHFKEAERIDPINYKYIKVKCEICLEMLHEKMMVKLPCKCKHKLCGLCKSKLPQPKKCPYCRKLLNKTRVRTRVRR